jgi:hypothetical protein
VAQAREAKELVDRANRLVRQEPIQAETMYQQAILLDPGYDEAPRRLGDLYAQQSETARDAESRASLLVAAGESYLRSAQLASAVNLKERDRIQSASAFYLAAQDSRRIGQNARARQYLYEARQVAPPGSEIAQAVAGLLADLTGG